MEDGWLDELERLNAIALTWYRATQVPMPTAAQPGVTVTLPGGTATATASPIVVLALAGLVIVVALNWG